jgi:hypothetical protein
MQPDIEEFVTVVWVVCSFFFGEQLQRMIQSRYKGAVALPSTGIQVVE